MIDPIDVPCPRCGLPPGLPCLLPDGTKQRGMWRWHRAREEAALFARIKEKREAAETA